jgi:photosystem II stability/assembly factor-like uncharacterized protein
MRSNPAWPVLAIFALLLSLGCHDNRFKPRDYAGEIDIFDDLFSVSVPTGSHAVASGYWGAIYVTKDGGVSWTKADTGTQRLLYGVSMADDRQGWAVGQLGLVLRTEDGGLTWKEQPNPKEGNVHFFDVQALDGQRAWIVGEWGTRIYTSDGGETWADHSLTIDDAHPQFVWLSPGDQDKVRNGEKVFEDVGLNDLYCLPAEIERCWMIGEFGYIFRTETGGVDAEGASTWEPGRIVGSLSFDPIVLAYNEIEITQEDHERVIEFANSVLDAEHLNLAIEPRASAREIAAFGGSDDPFPLFEILEARTQSVQAAIEETGILTDRIRRRGAPPWDYEDFVVEDPEFLDRYMETRQTDQPVVELKISQNPFLFTIRFSDPEQGLISGLGGVVLKTGDGGRTWRYEGIGRKRALFSLQKLSNRAIVVGEKGLISVSNDGGVNWARPDGFPTLFTFMRDISFDPDGRIGFIVGQSGKILRSDDSGKSWSTVLPPDSRRKG